VCVCVLQGRSQRSDRELGDRRAVRVLVAAQRAAAGAAGPARHLVLPHRSHRHQSRVQGEGRRRFLVFVSTNRVGAGFCRSKTVHAFHWFKMSFEHQSGRTEKKVVTRVSAPTPHCQTDAYEEKIDLH